jgi:uncharacterized protein
MPYLVDGHNLIPKIPGFSLKAIDDEMQLIQMLQVFCRQKQKNCEVFFDNAPAGQARKDRSGRLTIHFIRQGRTADSAIRQRLHQLGAEARNWTVISSDRAIQAAAREQGAQPLKSESFASQLLESQENQSPPPENLGENPSNEEINDWLRLFGEKPTPKKGPKS